MSIYDRFSNSSDSMKSAIRTALELAEGQSTGIHLDSRNILTFASGSALARPDGTLFPPEHVNARLTAAGQTALSTEAYDQLKSVGDKTPNERVAAFDLLKKANTEIESIATTSDQRTDLLNFELGEQARLIDARIVLFTTASQRAGLYSNLTDNQFSAILQLGYNNPGALIGPRLVRALAANDDWAAFKEILLNSNKDQPGGDAANPNSGLDEKGLQARRFREAAKFSPFSGEGGLPASFDEAVSVLTRYVTPGIVEDMVDNFHARSVPLTAEGVGANTSVQENLTNFFPYDKIMGAIAEAKTSGTATPLQISLAEQLLDAAARQFERVLSTKYGRLFEIPGVPKLNRQGPLVPRTEGRFIIPLSDLPFDPSTALTIRIPISEIGEILPIPEGNASIARPTLHEASRNGGPFHSFSNRDELNDLATSPQHGPPATHIVVEGPSAGTEVGNASFAAIVSLANQIASQQLGIADPLTAVLVDVAVGEAVKQVTHQALTNLGLKPASWQQEFGDRLESGMAAGLTALVTSQIMGRLLDKVGVHGLPADAITSLASSTASTYMLSVLELGPKVGDLASVLDTSLQNVGPTLVGNAAIALLGIDNPVAKTAGNVASSIVMAMSWGGPWMAAAAMVATTIIFDVLGIGVDPDGPIGKINIDASSGLFAAMPATIERNGFAGPPEQLTMVIQAQMDVAVPVLNAALNVIGARVASLPGTTGLRFYLKSRTYRSLIGTVEKPFGSTAAQLAQMDFIERTFQTVTLSVPPDADPILVKVLRRGWYDWVINSTDPEYRASLPADDDIYAQHDLAVWVNQTARISMGPFRAPRGTVPEIIAGLLNDLRHVAGNVASVIIAYIERVADQSPPPAGLGDPVTCFDRLDTAILSLIPLAQKRGFTCPAMPTGIVDWPTDMPAVPDGYDYLYEMLSRVRAWRDLAAVPLVQTSATPIPPPAGVAVTGTPDPALTVTWQPVGSGEAVSVRWREGNGAWSENQVGGAASALALPSVRSGRSYSVQAKRLAAPVAGAVQRESAWTPVQTALTPTGLAGKARVVGLELAGQGPDTSFRGKDVRLAWGGAFPDMVGRVEAADSVLGGAPFASPYMQGYRVRGFDPVTGAELFVSPVQPATEYLYAYEDNVRDGGPRRRLRFTVSIVPKIGAEIGKASIVVENPAPPKVGVSATIVPGGLRLEVEEVRDLDLAGYAVWISQTPLMVPPVGPPTLHGIDRVFLYPTDLTGPFHILAAAYDGFRPQQGWDNDSLNFHPPILFGRPVPASPTHLTATIGLRTITLSWRNPPGSDQAFTEIWSNVTGTPPTDADADSMRIASLRGTGWVHHGPEVGEVRYYWLRLVNPGGVAGPFSERAAAAARAIGDADFTTGSIDATVIRAGTIAADLLEIGSRNLTFGNLLFWANERHPDKQAVTNHLRWGAVGAGTASVDYPDPTAQNGVRRVTLLAGGLHWVSGVVFVYFDESLVTNHQASLQHSADYATASASGRVVLASYAGGLDLQTTYGTTIIHRNLIQTGAIEAGHIKAGEITAGIVKIGPFGAQNAADLPSLYSLFTPNSTTIDGGKITTGSIEADAIKAGSIDTSRLKVNGRILSITGLGISYSDRTLDWDDGTIVWTNNSGEQKTSNVIEGSLANVPLGMRIQLYWVLDAHILQTTTATNSNAPEGSVILATFQPGQRTPLIRHHKDVLIAGNSLKAGEIHSNIIRGDLIDAREMRIGATYDGEPGLYFRAVDSGQPQNAAGAREGQIALFAFAKKFDAATNTSTGHRRAQMYVSANGLDAGFEAWDADGRTIFDSNGLRPESATFVRSSVGQGRAIVRISINGLQAGQVARIVIFANSNGDGDEFNTLLHIRGPTLADNWDADADNYIGFKRDAQGLLVREYSADANGELEWRCWCTEGRYAVNDTTIAEDKRLQNLTVGLVVFVSMR